MFVEIKSNIENFYKNGRLPFLLNSVGSTVPQEKIIRPNGFFCHHILWVTDGRGLFTVNGKTFRLEAGEGVFLKAETPHSYAVSGENFNSEWITFYGLDGLLNYYGIKDYFIFDVPSTLKDSAKSLYKHSVGNSSVLSRSSLGYSVITEFLDSQFAPKAPLTQRIDRILEARFNEDISLNDIAQSVSMNKFTLCKKYTQTSGITLNEQLKKIRIAKAKRYLLSTAYSAETISGMCGFKSPSYFGKVFKEITGLTPKEYRLKHK